MSAPLRLGTRSSGLARAQSEWVAGVLRAAGHEVTLVPVSTTGDTSTAPLATIGGSGVFVGAVREALLAGEVDLAVHSLKDLPTAQPDRIALAAVPAREDPRDALVASGDRTLGELPAGSTVATGSPRRVAQLAALGLGLDLVGIRGNVDTRLAAVHEGRVDGVVLAYAGLRRLGRAGAATEVLDPIQMLPAPGQGALAVETRADEPLTALIAALLDDPGARAAVTAERALLAELEAGCSAPVGALAEVAEGEHGEEIWLRAVALSPDGSNACRRSATGNPDDPAELGRKLAAEMLADGAAELIGPQPDQPPEHPPEHPAEPPSSQ